MAKVPFHFAPGETTHDGNKLNANFDALGATSGVTPQAPPSTLVDDTTGTASTTFGAIAGTTYATDAPAIKNALAQIVVSLNAITTKLIAAGVLT